MAMQRIGEPLRAFKMATAAYGQAKDGGNRIYTVAQGKPCRLYVIDADTGSGLGSFSLDGSNHSWGICMTADGSVYMGGDGYLYRYDPVLHTVDNLGIPIEGETYFWRLAADQDGNVYGGTYPGGKVFQYKPSTKAFHDYGTMVPGECYARSMDAGPNQKLYVGVGTGKGEIVELDTRTGETRRLPVPEGQEHCTIVYDLDVHEGLLFARYTDTLDLMVYDLALDKWVHRIDGAGGFDVSAPDDNHHVYLLRNGYLHAFNLISFELVQLPLRHEGAACDFGWMEWKEPDFPGKSLVSMYEGGYFLYNPVTKKTKHIEVDAEGVPVAIQSLTAGSDGTIHIGGYFAGGYASYNPAEDRLSPCHRFGQSEYLHVFKDKLYLGVYPGAYIYEYDPSQPWEKDINPKIVFSLKDQGQDRPFALASTEERLIVGTVPKYSKLGGALALYDPVSGQMDCYTDVVTDQSIIALCYSNGYIYGGTSVFGGLGGSPSQQEGKLFVWDAAAGRKVWEGVPIVGEKVVSALTVGKDGVVWGMTSGHLFAFNPASKTIERRFDLFEPIDWANRSHFWRGVFLDYDRAADKIYGNCMDKLFSFDVRTEQLEVLATGGTLFARDGAGTMYVTKETELYKVLP